MSVCSGCQNCPNLAVQSVVCPEIHHKTVKFQKFPIISEFEIVFPIVIEFNGILSTNSKKYPPVVGKLLQRCFGFRIALS
jgi:hypothetical protein